MLRYREEEKLDYDYKLLHFNHGNQAAPYTEEIKKYRAVSKIGAFAWEKEMNVNGLFYISGPPGFVNTACGYLEGRGVRPQNIITDSFTGY